MLSRFFIDRPDLRHGAVGRDRHRRRRWPARSCPIAQYPEVAPPTVQVTATYPGANAKTVADTVATPIEQEVNGVESMLYMSSQCTNDGQMTLDVTFELGTNLDMAQVLVQNRVADRPGQAARGGQAPGRDHQEEVAQHPAVRQPRLAEAARTAGYYYDQLYLSNFATLNVKDDLARIKGVGDVTFLGPRDYSMRIWLDPDKLAGTKMTAGDVITPSGSRTARSRPAGSASRPCPARRPCSSSCPSTRRAGSTSEEQFENIVVKTGRRAASSTSRTWSSTT